MIILIKSFHHQIRLSEKLKNVDKWLKRVSDVAEGNIETLRTQIVKGDKKDEINFIESGKCTSDELLMASSLNCLFEIDMQRGGYLSRDYTLYINAFYPPLVRITALECFIRLSLSKCLTQR